VSATLKLMEVTRKVLRVGTLALLLVNSSTAQERNTFQKSFFSSQVTRIDAPGGRLDLAGALTLEDVVSQQYHADGAAVNDTIVQTERQQGALTFVKNVYDPVYIDNIMNERMINALELDSDAAQRLAAYQASLTISKVLSKSPIANMYAEFTENLRAVRNNLMWRVSRQGDGSLGFEPRRDYGRRETFLELRMSPSTRDGIQPRLRLGENVSVSYDFSEGAPLLEYNINF